MERQHSNDSTSCLRNDIKQSRQYDKIPFFKANTTAINNSNNALLKGIMLMIVGGVLMTSITLSIQSSNSSQQMFEQMNHFSEQLNKLGGSVVAIQTKQEFMQGEIVTIQQQLKEDHVKTQEQMKEGIVNLQAQMKEVFKTQEQAKEDNAKVQEQMKEGNIKLQEQMKEGTVKLQDEISNEINKNAAIFTSQANEIAALKASLNQDENTIIQIKKDIEYLQQNTSNLKQIEVSVGILKNEYDQVQIIKDTLSKVVLQQIQNQKDLDSLPGLSTTVSVLQSQAQRLQSDMTVVQQLSPKMEGISVDLTNLKGDMNKLQTQQQSLPVTSSSQPGIISPNIELHGPYLTDYWKKQIWVSGKDLVEFPSSLCLIATKGRAIITVTGTGLATCGGDCHGQMTFLKNGQLHLKEMQDRLQGSQHITSIWAPINLTQEFEVEAGPYQFTIAFNAINGSFQFYVQSLSFVVKVQYIQ